MGILICIVISAAAILVASELAVRFWRIRCPICKGWMKYHFSVEEDCIIWTCPKCGKKVRVYE